ncbi:DUF1801 domain-containing protein [Paenibacillus sp. sptzw28]|uniref:DUF1801 domain-containing protein n=1 Tax=Paenibacillus sp. sptzw28 TaxID=715179 RepID=UPI001C6ECE9E|nr:DUF1801 domain-containing protein [Paenibacillus sp. sptzw28]QYR21440.1 DUF1801 domain-containing protein [Paenibacillus sp. sptzw28]
MAANEKTPETSGKKSTKSGRQQVLEFLNDLEHPLKEEIEEVRKIILSANDSITEHIKWNAPSFCFNNEDRITFNLQGKGFFRLVFHCGAKVKDHAMNKPLFEDTSGLLGWVTADRAIIKLTDRLDVESKRAKLTEVVTEWIKFTDTKKVV